MRGQRSKDSRQCSASSDSVQVPQQEEPIALNSSELRGNSDVTITKY